MELLYKVVGKGTAVLSQRRTGEVLDVQGPFGNAFPMPSEHQKGSLLLVGGGIGVAPLVILAERIRKQDPMISITAFIGGRTRADVLCVSDFQDVGSRVVVATEDGSLGYKGYVTDLLGHYLQEEEESRGRLYACGPHAMLSRLSQMVGASSIPASFSLEAVMACGMGLCMGCAERGSDGHYPLVCLNGPIFSPEAISWK